MHHYSSDGLPDEQLERFSDSSFDGHPSDRWGGSSATNPSHPLLETPPLLPRLVGGGSVPQGYWEGGEGWSQTPLAQGRTPHPPARDGGGSLNSHLPPIEFQGLLRQGENGNRASAKWTWLCSMFCTGYLSWSKSVSGIPSHAPLNRHHMPRQSFKDPAQPCPRGDGRPGVQVSPWARFSASRSRCPCRGRTGPAGCPSRCPRSSSCRWAGVGPRWRPANGTHTQPASRKEREGKRAAPKQQKRQKRREKTEKREKKKIFSTIPGGTSCDEVPAHSPGRNPKCTDDSGNSDLENGARGCALALTHQKPVPQGGPLPGHRIQRGGFDLGWSEMHQKKSKRQGFL